METKITRTVEHPEDVIIKFAGDSGDGMQLTGALFTDNTALSGNDLATFPDYPAEIRAPSGTPAGVSGFQLHFGSRRIFTPGDEFDVLVAMNAAALRVNLPKLKKGGILIVNADGFERRDLRLAKYEEDRNPLEDGSLHAYRVHTIPITKLTRESLQDIPVSTKDKDRCKNMFVLGFLYWRFNREIDSTIEYLRGKFGKKPELMEANLRALRDGFAYGEHTDTFRSTVRVAPAPLAPGTYRNITGNHALSLGLIAAAHKAELPLFYGSYPITPASDILHHLARHKNYGVRTFQAEDEIAAICSAIGAAYGGHLGVTGTSGPGMALKTEALGLALMLELPLIIINVQRGGPSTGLPTKTEQADLLQALYGRNGESPVVVIAAHSAADCFDTAFEAARLAIEHMTPVILLSDGYIGNSAEPWRIPRSSTLPGITASFAKEPQEGQPFLPYARDERLVRAWAVAGTPGLAHRIGGLEKEYDTGNVSYDPENHQRMVKTRQAKVDKIAAFIPEQSLEAGPEQGKLLFLGWGSTYGVIRTATESLLEQGHAVAHAHLRYLNPMPRNLGDILECYDQIIIPEINNGQLSKIIRERFLREVIPFNKIQGVPITKSELLELAARFL